MDNNNIKMKSPVEIAADNCREIAHLANGFAHAIRKDYVEANKNRLMVELDCIERMCIELRRYFRGQTMFADGVQSLVASDIHEKIMNALPHESGDGHFWVYSGDILLCDSAARADAIADLLDALYGDQTAMTGYYDPKEDEKAETIDAATGWHYVDIS